MSKKCFSLLLFSLCLGGILIASSSVRSSHCSEILNKCEAKCYEIQTNDELQNECLLSCKKDYNKCIKEHPESEWQDHYHELNRKYKEEARKVDLLERHIRQLRQEVDSLRNACQK